MKKKSKDKDNEKIIVSESEIKEDLKNSKRDDDSKEPSWYHYVIILLVIVAFFGVFYFTYYVYEKYNSPDINENITVDTIYKYTKGNITYSIRFSNTVEDIEGFNFTVEPEKLDLLNTVDYRFSFMEYNGSENTDVGKASTTFISFLRRVYHFKVGSEDVVKYNETNCSDSTLKNKVVVFDPYSNVSGVFYNEGNGCIEFLSNGDFTQRDLADKLIYNIINE